MPEQLARVHPVTRTPVLATALVTLAVLVFALWLPLGILAERATQSILLVFTLVNAALIQIKSREDPAPPGILTVPIVFPVLGFLGCLMMLLGPLYFA